MKIRKNNWLSAQTEKELNDILELKQQNRFINQLKKLLEYIKGTKSIYIILPLLVIIYILTTFDFVIYNFITIPLTKDQATALLNNRITNIVTLFSVSVAIFIFIVNSLKDIRKGEDIFKLTLQETYFYPVLYYSISIIVINYFISFLVNSNSIEDVTYIRLSVLFMWLCIIQCFLIGYSFYLVYKAYDSSYINSKYLLMIEKQIQLILHQELKEKLSYNIYRKTLEKFNSLIVGYVNSKDSQFVVRSKFNYNMKIKDINMNLLIRMLEKQNLQGIYDIQHLNGIIYSKTPIFGIDNELVARNLNNNFDRIFKLVNIEYKKDFLKELKENLKAQGEAAIYSQDEMSFKNILNIHEKIHHYVIKSLQVYQYEEKFNLFPSTSIFDYGMKIVGRDHINIYNYFEKAVLKENKEIIIDILSFIYELYIFSLNNKSILLLDNYKFVYVWMYKFILKNQDLKKFYIERIALHLSEFVKMFLDSKNNDDYKDKLLMYYGRVYYTISEILYLSIRNGDFETYKRLIEYFESINRDYIYEYDYFYDDEYEENRVENASLDANILFQIKTYELYYIMFYGIKSWLMQLYRSDKIDFETYSLYINQIPDIHKSNSRKLLSIADYVHSGRGELYGFSEWGNEYERVPLKAYTPSHDPSMWLSFAGIVELIKLNFPNEIEINKLPLNDNLRYFSDRVNDVCNEILKNVVKWNILLKLASSEEEFIRKIINYKNNFARLKERFEIEEFQKIASQPISLEKVEVFKNGVYKTWKPFTLLNNLFKRDVNLIISENENLKSIKIVNHGIKYKMMFVDSGYNRIFGVEHYGGDLTQKEKYEFSKIIFNSANTINKYSNIIDLLEIEISKFTNSGKNANLIILFDRVYKTYKTLSENSKYAHYNQDNKGIRIPGYQGVYNGIPIYYLKNEKYKNSVIICNFEKAFSANVNFNKDYLDGFVNVQILDLTEDEINKEIEEVKRENYRMDYYRDNLGNPLSDDLIKLVLKSSVKMIIEEKIEFEIIDKSEYLISEVSP